METMRESCITIRSISCIFLAILCLIYLKQDVYRKCSEERFYNSMVKPYPMQRTYYQSGYVYQYVEYNLFHRFMSSAGFVRLSKPSYNCTLIFLHGQRDMENVPKKIARHQKVNRIPGFDDIVVKVDLATYPGMPNIPPAFRIPQDVDKLRAYANAHPAAKFLKKDVGHHDIEIIDLDEVSDLSSSSFVQLFVDRPLLADGHRFDFDVFVLVTSVDPLKAYMYKNNTVVKFCREKYYPIDWTNRNKYIVDNNFHSLPRYIQNKRSGKVPKDFVDLVISEAGGHLGDFWFRVDEVITEVLHRASRDIVRRRLLEPFGNERGFFEVIRVDFLVDEDLKLHLLEFERVTESLYYPIAEMFRPIFDMIGLGPDSAPAEAGKVEADAFVPPPAPAYENCTRCGAATAQAEAPAEATCPETVECLMCLKCWREKDRAAFAEAVWERHYGHEHYRRIFPRPMLPGRQRSREEVKSPSSELKRLGRSDWMLDQWFARKCAVDKKWCQ